MLACECKDEKSSQRKVCCGECFCIVTIFAGSWLPVLLPAEDAWQPQDRRQCDRPVFTVGKWKVLASGLNAKFVQCHIHKYSCRGQVLSTHAILVGFQIVLIYPLSSFSPIHVMHEILQLYMRQKLRGEKRKPKDIKIYNKAFLELYSYFVFYSAALIMPIS